MASLLVSSILSFQKCLVGVTVQDEDNTVHKIIEAGKDCGRRKDPENNGMVLVLT